MALFNKNKMASLSPLNPPTGRFGNVKKPKKNKDQFKAKPASALMNLFGKK